MKSQVATMILFTVIIFAVLFVAITSTVIGIPALILSSATIILFLVIVTNLISLLVDGIPCEDAPNNEKDDTSFIMLKNGVIVEYYKSYLDAHEVKEYKY